MLNLFLPNFVLQRYMKWKRKRQYGNKSVKEVFQQIYEQNRWGNEESVSGHGSDLLQTEHLRPQLQQLFSDLSIKSVLDIPCGDFNWMKTLDLSEISYIGADIVPDLIEKNLKNYASSKRDFQVLNLVNDTLPTVDMVLCRDCLVHLSYENIHLALQNIKKSGAKYLLVASFVQKKQNEDIVTGDWRPLNLEIAPFNLSHPMIRLLENCPVKGYEDKALLLYDVSQL